MARNSWLSRLLVFWPGRPWNAGLFFSVAGKATLLWPGLPQNPGLDRAYQAFPGHAILASPAKTLASLAWPGLAGLAMLLTSLQANKPTGSRSLNWFVAINPWKDNDEITNIWKSYMWTAECRIIWRNNSSYIRSLYSGKVLYMVLSWHY